MCEILIVGQVSRLRDEIEFFLNTSDISSQAISPEEIASDSIPYSSIAHILIIYEFPVFKDLSVVEKIRRATDVPIVIITSDCSMKFKKNLNELGVEKVINRPFEPKSLIEMIRP